MKPVEKLRLPPLQLLTEKFSKPFKSDGVSYPKAQKATPPICDFVAKSILIKIALLFS